jgi:hypothetical protein
VCVSTRASVRRRRVGGEAPIRVRILLAATAYVRCGVVAVVVVEDFLSGDGRSGARSGINTRAARVRPTQRQTDNDGVSAGGPIRQPASSCRPDLGYMVSRHTAGRRRKPSSSSSTYLRLSPFVLLPRSSSSGSADSAGFLPPPLPVVRFYTRRRCRLPLVADASLVGCIPSCISPHGLYLVTRRSRERQLPSSTSSWSS